MQRNTHNAEFNDSDEARVVQGTGWIMNGCWADVNLGKTSETIEL